MTSKVQYRTLLKIVVAIQESKMAVGSGYTPNGGRDGKLPESMVADARSGIGAKSWNYNYNRIAAGNEEEEKARVVRR
jgi:hypothetical protein